MASVNYTLAKQRWVHQDHLGLAAPSAGQYHQYLVALGRYRVRVLHYGLAERFH